LSDSSPSSESTTPQSLPARLARSGPYPTVEGILDRSLALVRYLRQHCAWDRKQTARSLVSHLLEETHETVDAIYGDDPAALRDELGDLLLNLAFQIVVAEEEGTFSPEEVVRGLEEKMVRRHPHLFGLGEQDSWEAIKARERSRGMPGPHSEAPPASPPDPGRVPSWQLEGLESETDETSGTLSGLARGLDPLLRAHRIQEKVAGVGFDWEDAAGALAKLREELDEVAEALESGDAAGLEEEVGDLIFSVVNLARLARAPAVPALMAANVKFERRFRALEALARERQIDLPGATLEELDRLWDEVKERE